MFTVCGQCPSLHAEGLKDKNLVFVDGAQNQISSPPLGVATTVPRKYRNFIDLLLGKIPTNRN